jgi:predicted molibdopterin-dependent oxidoreductase YjgC
MAGTGQMLRFATHAEPSPVPETSAEQPMVLVGGTAFHFDDGLMTRHSALAILDTEHDFFGMNAEDMAALGLLDGTTVTVTSDAGDAAVVIGRLDSLPSGMAFVPRWSASAKQLFGHDSQDETGAPRYRTVHVGAAASGVTQGGE